MTLHFHQVASLFRTKPASQIVNTKPTLKYQFYIIVLCELCQTNLRLKMLRKLLIHASVLFITDELVSLRFSIKLRDVTVVSPPNSHLL